ncbi:MAG: hypothetical protein IAE79_27225 [Anaerolinea sp.]|nr:hypothetical protein [Anaerolinea sp.]
MNDENRETAVFLSQLRQTLIRYFDKSDLHHLAADLGVEFDELPGATRSDKALALIDYLQRHGRLPDLITRCRQLRPHAAWPEMEEGERPLAPPPATPIRDNLSRYEIGLDALQAQLGSDHPRYGEFLLYQQRLTENLAQARRYGDTETRRAERAEIVDQLNALSLAVTGVPFNKFCQ